MSDQILALLPAIGLPLLFAATFSSCFGLPVPGTLVLLVGGSLAATGDMTLSSVVLVALVGALLGDQVGFQIGKHGGGLVEIRFATSEARRHRIKRAKTFTTKWGGPGVFFSRWLISPLGPWVNLAGGMLGLSWSRFTLSSATGEVLWVGIFVSLGYTLSDTVIQAAVVASEYSLLLVSGSITLLLGWRMRQVLRR